MRLMCVAFACVALEIASKGLPPFKNSRGREGIKDKILKMFGSPPDAVIKTYRWVGVEDRVASDPIPWGLWWGDKSLTMILQHALRYDMCRRPTMQACRQVFDKLDA